MTPRILITAAAAIIGCAPAFAEDRPTSRHTFRTNQIDAGNADRLVQPRVVTSEVRVVQAAPLRGEARTTSTVSASTSNLTGRSAVSATRAPISAVRAPVVAARAATQAVRVAPVATAPGIAATEASIVRNTPLVAATAAEDAQPQIDDRAAVDNNARLATNWRSYAPATVSYEQAQLALGAHRVQEVRYGNTYGTYSPEEYYGRTSYASYPSRTYYYPTGYYGHRTYFYSDYHYTPTYCAPVYYHRPSYSYCAPTYYHRPAYSYCGPRYYSTYGSYYRPTYTSFRYSYSSGGRHCGSGSRFGFSIGW